MISGTNYLSDKVISRESYFFSQHFTIWGWATWRRAWEFYDVEMKEWERIKREDQLGYLTNKFYIKKHFEVTFDLIAKSRMDTWDIQWVFACFFSNGLCITPKCNLISNIGVDGAHAGGEVTDSHFLKTAPIDTQNLIHPVMVFPNKLYDQTLHRLKNKSVVRKMFIQDILRKSGMYNIAKYIYRKIKKN